MDSPQTVSHGQAADEVEARRDRLAAFLGVTPAELARIHLTAVAIRDWDHDRAIRATLDLLDALSAHTPMRVRYVRKLLKMDPMKRGKDAAEWRLKPIGDIARAARKVGKARRLQAILGEDPGLLLAHLARKADHDS